MSLFPPGLAYYSWQFDNFGTNPSATPGTSVTPGASNAEGAWTQVASAANIANDVYGFYVRVSDGATTGTIKDHLLDIGIDPAGGTSYVPIISNIVCGASGPITAAAGHQFFFPLFIRAGASVAVRVQGVAATAGTVRVGFKCWGRPSRPESAPVGFVAETLGTITNSQGVTFTPGNAADGAWTLLGTTTLPLWWWNIGYQVSNTTVTAEYTYIEIGYGDGTDMVHITEIMHQGTTSEQIGNNLCQHLTWLESFHPVPAGSSIYVRGRCNNAPDTGYNAVAIGIGG